MPKAKKLRAPALDSQQVRHEPLGQVIEGDSQKGSKYAPTSTGRRKIRSKENGTAGDGEFLDEKTSRKILDMSREQQIEEEIDEQRVLHQKNQRHQQQQQYKQAQLNKGMLDDSDEEEEDEEIEDIIIDEGDYE